ncbi:MAG TPA: four helix bundle protein [Fimbriimonadaceae bacterium]|nr:four helix bundle protein [Fimbriimonadaceae bacterium]
MSKHLPIEETELFGTITIVSDEIWDAVQRWGSFAKSTTDKQLVRAVDSIGANLVEGDGRYSDAEAIHFFEIARGSAREARYWIDVAKRRRLLPHNQALDFIRRLDMSMQMLNGLISYRRRTKNVGIVREEASAYRSAPTTLDGQIQSFETLDVQSTTPKPARTARPTLAKGKRPNAKRQTPNAVRNSTKSRKTNS